MNAPSDADRPGTAPNGADTLRVLVLATSAARREELAAELAPALEHVAEVITADPGDAPHAPTDRTTAVVLLVSEGADPRDVDGTIAALDRDDDLAAACLVLLTGFDRHEDLTDALDRDRLAAVITLTWEPGELARQTRSHVARWLRARDPDDPRLPHLDQDGRPLELPTSELLRDLEVDDLAVATRLVAGLERALGPRPRLVVPEGTRLTREGVSVDAVFVLLRGSVALERTTRVGPLRLHHGSTGPVIGLLSLAQRRRAFFTSRTTTTAELVHVSIEQLDLALQQEPDVGAALAAIAITGLARRLRRAEQLQLERIELNRDLEQERRRLTRTLEELEDTRDELVRQARLASLGELAAGVAHELNNPVAALSRAARFIADDTARLLEQHPDTDLLADVIAGTRDRPPLTTAEERARRRDLADAVGDADLARLLVAAGIEDRAEARELAAAVADREGLSAAVGLGTALRNLEVAAARVSELVSSLRTYARPGQEPIAGIDLHEVVDDALRLVGHRVEEVRIVREYGEIPPLRIHPGEIGQVVGNLVVNAAEALDGPGTITVVTRTEGDEVVLEVVDDGPGIPADDLARLFEPRFTTKQGTVRYGLGLGLSIVRRIVNAHGGRFDLRSRPGRTVAEVRLPSGGER